MRKLYLLLTLFLSIPVFSTSIRSGFGRLVTMETAAPSPSEGALLGLRRSSVPLGRGWRISSNLLADALLLVNLNLKKSFKTGRSTALVFGVGGFYYCGDSVARELGHLFMKELKDFHTSLQGGRAFCGWSFSRPAFELHLGASALVANSETIVDAAVGLRWKPGQVFSVEIEAGYQPLQNRFKPGISLTVLLGSFRCQLGVVYNPIDDPAVYFPVIPVFDIGVSF